MHPTNQHTLKPVYVGEISNRRFKIVYAIDGLVSPDSYTPTFGRTEISQTLVDQMAMDLSKIYELTL